MDFILSKAFYSIKEFLLENNDFNVSTIFEFQFLFKFIRVSEWDFNVIKFYL